MDWYWWILVIFGGGFFLVYLIAWLAFFIKWSMLRAEDMYEKQHQDNENHSANLSPYASDRNCDYGKYEEPEEEAKRDMTEQKTIDSYLKYSKPFRKEVRPEEN